MVRGLRDEWGDPGRTKSNRLARDRTVRDQSDWDEDEDETHLQVPSQRVHDLLRLNVVVNEDVLSVRERVQCLLQAHALTLQMFLECIGA